MPAGAAGFVGGLGLRAKPKLVRLRLDPALGIAAGLTEVTARRKELAALDLTVARALVVENEITFLNVPVPRDGMVLWGKGFEATSAVLTRLDTDERPLYDDIVADRLGTRARLDQERIGWARATARLAEACSQPEDAARIDSILTRWVLP